MIWPTRFLHEVRNFLFRKHDVVPIKLRIAYLLQSRYHFICFTALSSLFLVFISEE